MMTGVAIFLVGLVIGLLTFDAFLTRRISEMESLMFENNMYDPILLQKATTHFWIPLEKIFAQRKSPVSSDLPGQKFLKD